MVPQLGHAGLQEAFDRVTRFRQHAPVGGKARALDGETEVRRHFARPFPKSRRRLCPVKRAVYLDRSQALAGIGEFLRVWQPLGVEVSAPRLEGPAADADTDLA